MSFHCKRCGWCCRNIVINVSYSDIVRWYHHQRYDILREVSFINNYPQKNTGGFYIRETTFNPKRPCPFFTSDNKCAIYQMRPMACRDFPLERESVPKCEGFKDFRYNKVVATYIRKRQYKDFKMAHDNWTKLLQLLIIARRK